MPGLVAAYMVLWGVSGLPHWNITDFDAFFLPAARVALAGHPFAIYQVRYLDIYPDANGPLSILPLTLVAAIAQQLHWLNDPSLRRMLVMGAFAVFPLLMAREALLASDRLRARPLAGWPRVFAWGLIILSPELWHTVLLYGHIEIPIMLWLTLLAIRALVSERIVLAGALLGLALLTRSMSVLYLMPLVAVLLAHRRWLAAVRVSAVAGLVTALGLLPFWLADRNDLIYSLFTFRSGLIVGGGSIWGLFLGTPLEAVGLRYDAVLAIVVALALTIITLTIRPDLRFSSRDIYLLLALTGLCFPFFIKTLWPYYFLDPYVWFAVWWITGDRLLPDLRGLILRVTGLALPLAAVATAQIAEQGLSVSVRGVWLPGWSAAVCAALFIMMTTCATILWAGEARLASWLTRHPRAQRVDYNTNGNAPPA